MRSAIDELVSQSAARFVDELAKLNEDPYVREAIMKLAVREVSWGLLRAFDDQYGLADQLDVMAGVIRDHKEESA